MKNRIIVDSCCDMTSEMKNEMGIVLVPSTMTLGNMEYRDDEFLDINDFMDKVSQFAGKTGSASPSPFLYKEAIESSENAYIVTLSGKLSGSYNNAVIGNHETAENGLGAACKETRNENLVTSHCNNRSMAEQLRALIKERFHFKKIYVVPTGGLSSLYADDKGIVLAF